MGMIARLQNRGPFGPCKSQTDPRGLKWTTANSVSNSPTERCCVRCGIFAKADEHRLGYIVCGHWSGECFLFHRYQAKSEKIYIHFRWIKIYILVLFPLPPSCVISPILCYNTVQRDLTCLDILKSMTLIHYTDDIVLSRLDRREVASILEAFLRRVF